MSNAAKHRRTYRAKRRAEGGCISCAQPAIEGESHCPHHKEAARLRRARYEQRKREASGRTQAARNIELAERRAARIAALIAWAETHGVVPTYGEAARIIGWSEGSKNGTEMQVMRREAFGLRTFARDEISRAVRIPFPVPAKYRAIEVAA